MYSRNFKITKDKYFERRRNRSEELKRGDGRIAKHGDLVTVYYINIDEAAIVKYKFKLGCKHSAESFNIGVSGMKVGSIRKITRPAGFDHYELKKDALPAFKNRIYVTFVELKVIH